MIAPISRDWATPLALGTFALMAVTGLLMFFHLNNPLQEALHSWAGWVLVAAVLLHVLANWMGFKRHFQSVARAPALMGLAALVVTVSFALAPGGEAAEPVPVIAIQALTRAPLRQVAPLFGKTPDQARRELAAAGIVVPDDDTAIGRVVGADREKTSLALQVLAGRGGR